MNAEDADRLSAPRQAFVNVVGAIVAYAQAAPKLVLAGALALTVLASGYAAENLDIDTDTTGMISEELPFRKRFKAFRDAFPALSDNVVIVIDAAIPDRADEAMETLVRRLAADRESFPLVFAPEADRFFVRNGLLYLDIDDLEALSDDLADSQAFLATLSRDPTLRGLETVLRDAMAGIEEPAQARRLASVLQRITVAAEGVAGGNPAPMSWRKMINHLQDEGTVRRIILTKPRVDFSSLSPAADAMEKIRRLAADAGLTVENGISVRLTGGVVISTEELESVTTGARNAGLASLFLVAMLLAWGIRSLRLVVAILIALLAGLVWTAGFTALSIGHLNLVSVAFAVLFIGLGVDFGIHFTLRFREERLGPGDQREVMSRTGHALASPLGLSALAAASSFFSFMPTDYRGLSELGLIAGVGMFIAFAATFTVVPAFLSLFAPPAPSDAPKRWIPPLPDRRIAIGALILGVGAAVAVPFAQFDLDPIKLRDPSTESVRTYRDLAATPGASLYTIELLAPSLSEAYSLANRLRVLPEVEKALTAANLVPNQQNDKLAIIEDMNVFLAPLRLPNIAAESGNKEETFKTLRQTLMLKPKQNLPELVTAAQTLNLAMAKLKTAKQIEAFEADVFRYFRQQMNRLTTALDAGPVALRDLPASIRERYLAANGRARVQVYPRDDLEDPAALRKFVDAVREIAPEATGSPVEILEAGRAVVNSVVTAAAISLIVVSGMVFLILRSARDTAMVLIPLVLAALYTVAATVILSMPFNFANVIVLPLLIGLGVASGIHLVSRARAENSAAAAFASTTPRAVMFSALTTIASFGSLAISGHRGTASMGELLTLSIGITLVCTLMVLPALMRLWPVRPQDAS
ncbi:MAG: MMPL family transporter [Pseudomonadota bacterium]|nr:MMPL family transporter [Pseudomonadota bacterium]